MSENNPVIRETSSPAFWLQQPSVEKLYRAVKQNGGDLRAVGGAVRDYLLKPSANREGDIDFACDLHPDDIKKIAGDLGAETRLHGEEHGTVMLILQGKAYEITALRRDVKTFGRHAEVEFGGDWHSDALRRDFTVNAMSMDAEGKIYDYCGGLSDLQAAEGAPKIRFVGEAERRVQEDYLRILRFFRFFSILPGAELQQQALAVCAKHADALSGLSVERRRDEFLKLLAGPQAAQALSLMNENGILKAMNLPAEVPSLPCFADNYGDDNFRMNFYLLSFADKNIEDFCTAWRLHNRHKRLLTTAYKIAASLQNGEALDYLLQLHGGEACALAVALVGALIGENQEHWQKCLNWQAVEFPIGGHDIRTLLRVEGSAVGSYLEQGLRHWLTHDRQLQRDELLSWYKNLAKNDNIS